MAGITGSTRPSSLLFTGGFACGVLGEQLGGRYWLFALSFIVAVLIDAYRVAIHEEENSCG